MDKVGIADNGISDLTYRHPLGQGTSLNRYELEDISSSFSSSSLSVPSTPPPLPPSCTSSGGTYAIGAGGIRYIVHRVTMMDTLAGVAIKYGVEVADLKRINGLVTDRQMFAHKTLHIPLPGRHPPSSHLSNGSEPDSNGLSNSEQTPVRRRNSDLFETFQSLKLTSSSAPNKKMSSAMNTLQGYYGLKPSESSSSSPYNPPLNIHRKSKSLANGLSENGDIANAESDKRSGEKLFRRRQKSETDFTTSDDNSSCGGFSASAGKGLALRSKPSNRTSSGFDSEAGWSNPIPSGFGDSLVTVDSLSVVRKSSSASSLQEQENGSSSSSSTSTSIWSSLKPDLQAFSTARPIFDGLPNPITGWKNKAALD